MDQVPAIVVGSGLSVLGAIRLLGRAGITVYCYGEPGIEARSRWYKPAPECDPYTARASRLASYLAGCPLERAVLLPASDAAMAAIAALPPSLAQRFPACIVPPGVADQLCDKALFAEMLARASVSGPVTRRIDSLKDIEAFPRSAFAGAFLKPTDSARFMERFGVKGIRVTSREDAVANAVVPLAEGHRLVLQEYIPNASKEGRLADHILIDAFVDSGGAIKAAFARRRMRMFPLDFGNTTYMVSIRAEDVSEPLAALHRIAKHLNYRGILSGEFKQDPRDGVYKILEINSRLWWFVEYAGRCGVDVCKMSYQDALGLPVDEVKSYNTGVKFVHMYYDFHAILALIRARKLGLGEAVASWVGAQEPYFNWTDFNPFFRDLRSRLKLRTRISSKWQPAR
jgi:predicted ATP-grasp superfamily ATP-dependent carboligase